jgi:hypothetical protein
VLRASAVLCWMMPAILVVSSAFTCPLSPRHLGPLGYTGVTGVVR